MKPLQENDKVYLDGKTYVIKKCLGRGSTCFSYWVERSDTNTPYVLKEICPLKLENELRRYKPDDCYVNIIPCEDLSEGNTASEFSSIIKKYAKLVKDYRSAATTTVNNRYPLLKYLVIPEEMSNAYIITRCDDYLLLSEYINLCSFEEGLIMLISVCNTLRILYENGYYVTDIKPTNIEYDFEKDTSLGTKFFDLDSICKKESIKDPESVFSFSLGYFPNDKQFTEQTIVYALGVMLLEVCFPVEFKTYRDYASKNGIVRFPISLGFEDLENTIRFSERYANGKNFGETFSNFKVKLSKETYCNDEALNKTMLELLLELWKKANCDEGERVLTLKEFSKEIQIIKDCLCAEGEHPAVFLLKGRQKRNKDIENHIFNPEEDIDDLLIPEFEIIE